MATDANGKWIGLGIGDIDDPATPRNAPNWHAVSLLNQKLYDRFHATHPLGQVRDSDQFTDTTAQSVELIAGRYGMAVPHDANGKAAANLAFRSKIGAYPPPSPPTHAAFTVRGTGGIIGQDYTSQIAQALPGLYHEHPINYPATMGGIPVAAASAGPSGNECAELARQMLTDAVLGSTVSFSVFGYSLGCKGPDLFLNDLFDPQHALYEHRDRLVCAVLVADPWRPHGRAFYGAPIPEGEGIGAPYFTMSPEAQNELGYRCCWLTNPADLYANAPLGGTGAVLADVEEIVLNLSASDPLNTMMAAVQELAKLVTQDAGLMQMLGAPPDAGPQGGVTNLPGGLGGILGGLGGLLGGGGLSPVSTLTGLAGGAALSPALALAFLPLLMGGFQGLLAGISGNGQDLPKGPGADVQAMILALKFFGSGTAPHIHYHDTPWSSHGPQTFLQLGIQHAADWGSRTPVLT